MQKELIIATTSQETKIAILENDELVEYYIERHRSQGIVGNIYKGRVTKVLPGMQSAFVDIGLERDAFLYVSDFLEDTDEYEKIVSTVEDEVAQLQEVPGRKEPVLPKPAAMAVPAAAIPVVTVVEAATVETPSAPEFVEAPVLSGEPEAAAAASPVRDRDRDRDRGRGPRDNRDRDRRDRGPKKPRIPSFENKSYEPRPEDRKDDRRPDDRRSDDRRADDRRPEVFGTIEALPGESLAKYSNRPPVETPSERGHEGAVSEEPTTNGEHQPSERTAAFEPMSDRPTSTETAGPAHGESSQQAEPEPTDASARISDQSDKYQMAHRPSGGRRPRRRGPGGPDGPNNPGGGPVGPGGPGGPSGRLEKSDDPRGNGHSKTAPTIAELLREGQEILVQISKEPLGKKGARITSHIALPGRYLVYMPTVDHVGVSRKIASDEERQRLKRVINENRAGLPGGFIVRTAAANRGEDEFVQDIRFLGNLWSDIRAKSEKRSAPTLIHGDLNLVQRILRDQLSSDFSAIRIDNEQEFATILDFVNKFQPALVNRVKLHLKDTPIFEEHGLNSEIDKALRPKVWLKSGGYIVINQTEALVAIDVNTGKFVGKSNRLEDTIVKTNLDAVHEIVRQVRLRNLGGIIVVDFIDMEEKKNRQRVMAALEEAIRVDRVPSKILQFNDFGLVAITRKRTQPSLERTICSPCSHCNGSGWTKSPETLCYEIQQELKKMTPLLDSKEITIRVNPEVAKVLKSGEFVSIHDLEEWTRKDIVVKSDPLLHEEHFDIF